MKSCFRDIPIINIAFNISASFTMRAASIIVTSLLVRQFGQEEFGHYIYIITTALLLTTLSIMSTGQTFIRNLSSEQTENDSFLNYFINIFLLFCVFSCLLYIYAFVITPNPHIADNFHLILLVAFFELINAAYVSYYSGKEKFANIFKARLTFSFFLCAIIFFTSYINEYYSIYPYVLALFLSNSYFFISSKHSLSTTQLKQLSIESFRYFYQKYIKISLPIFISGLMVTPVQWYLSNQIVVQNDFAELGLFNVSMQFRMMILMITNALATALLPRLVKLSNTDAFDRIKQSGYLVSAIVCVVMVVSISLFMPLIFNIYSIEINDDMLFTSYLMLSTALPLCIYNLYTQVLIAKGKTRILLMFNSFWGMCVIALYNMAENINNITVAKILCISYFALVFFVFSYNQLQKRKTVGENLPQ
jgi:O-antigen/teichoic acid export membrane protein